MAGHPMGVVVSLRGFSTGGGGRTAVLSGSQVNTYYAGLHREAASTLLESLLTLIGTDAYGEVVLIAGRGGHLPDIRMGSLVKLGASRAIVYLKRSEITPA